nr:hypothetical protein [Cellulophaga sp. HaHa_2_1]
MQKLNCIRENQCCHCNVQWIGFYKTPEETIDEYDREKVSHSMSNETSF